MGRISRKMARVADQVDAVSHITEEDMVMTAYLSGRDLGRRHNGTENELWSEHIGGDTIKGGEKVDVSHESGD